MHSFSCCAVSASQFKQKSQLHHLVFPLFESSLSVASSSLDPELSSIGSKEYGSSTAINLRVLMTTKAEYSVPCRDLKTITEDFSENQLLAGAQ